MSTEFAWDKNILPQTDTVSAVPRKINKEMIRDKNGNAEGPLDLVSIMVKVTGEAETDIITDLVNQIMAGVIPVDWGL